MTDAPLIVTGRFGQSDAHTLAGYQRTGGYEVLQRALTTMTPEQVSAEVKSSELLGRGGAGFPTGTKWGFLPAGVFPRYVVINGDESEPGTYKDRMLMELDPHGLIEGTMLTAYATGAAHAFIYVRGEMALAQERGHRAQRGLRGRASSAAMSVAPTSAPTSPSRGARARTSSARRRRSSRVSKATAACLASSRRTSLPPRVSTCSPPS